MTIAGLAVFYNPKISPKVKLFLAALSFCVVSFLLCMRAEMMPKYLMLLLTVTCSLIFIAVTKEENYNSNRVMKLGAEIGKRSYSIYIWHQPIAAFMFYSFFGEISVFTWIAFLLIAAILSCLSYQYVENFLGVAANVKIKKKRIFLFAAAMALILCSCSFVVYDNAGVVRDVPELGVYTKNVHRGMHAEYCDRPYKWNSNFDNKHIKVIVLGNSFGRDVANILYEWDEYKILQISYLYYRDNIVENNKKQIQDADYVFFAIGPNCSDVPSALSGLVSKEKLFVTGCKNYGKSNGIIYAHRFSETYYDQTIEISDRIKESNFVNKKKFGNHFIDLMAPVMVDESHVKVFTDDKKYISQDCRHLTQFGAEFYGRVLDNVFRGIFRQR